MDNNLQEQVNELQKKVDALYNLGTLPDAVKDNLVENGFLLLNKNLVWTNASGDEFQNLFIQTPDKEVVAQAYNSSQYKQFNVNPATEVFTSNNHGLTNGTVVYVLSTGTLPAPLNPTLAYAIANATTDTFKLTQGGSPVDITTLGNGFHFVTI